MAAICNSSLYKVWQLENCKGQMRLCWRHGNGGVGPVSLILQERKVPPMGTHQPWGRNAARAGSQHVWLQQPGEDKDAQEG